MRDMAREYASEVLKILDRLSRVKKATLTQVACCREILNRAWGCSPGIVSRDDHGKFSTARPRAEVITIRCGLLLDEKERGERLLGHCHYCR
jgi:hypothetical protein